MIYICNNCHFTFERPEKSDRCPDCGKQAIRIADEKEINEYRKLRIEFGYEKPASEE